jgi:hypothetical protein
LSAVPQALRIAFGVQLHPVGADGPGGGHGLGVRVHEQLTRTPRARASSISGLQARHGLQGKFQPWSLVNWPSLSGTKVHWWGRSSRTKSMRL